MKLKHCKRVRVVDLALDHSLFSSIHLDSSIFNYLHVKNINSRFPSMVIPLQPHYSQKGKKSLNE